MIRIMYKSFETERLLLKPTMEEDAELIYQLMNTPKFIQYVGDRGLRTIEDAKTFIQQSILPQLRHLGFSSYTLITKSDTTKIGTCGLYDRTGVDGIDIGFGLLPPFEGKGYAYEAANLLLSKAFDVFELHTVKAITSKDNLASQALIEKLGLERVGTTTLPNESKEILLYSLSRGD